MTFSSSLSIDKKQFPHHILCKQNQSNHHLAKFLFNNITRHALHASIPLGDSRSRGWTGDSFAIAIDGRRSWFPISLCSYFKYYHSERSVGPARFFYSIDRYFDPRSSICALSEQARSARLKLRANRRKAPCSGSPTEVDDHSSSPFHLLSLCPSLPILSRSPFLSSRLRFSLSLSLFFSLRSRRPRLPALSLFIVWSVCLSIFATGLSLSHPHIVRSPACSRQARDTPLRDRVGGCRCEPPRR